jgi:hypothetical protein
MIYDSQLHLGQNLLYLYSFLYNRHDDGLVEPETCRNYIINDKCLLIIDGTVCWTKHKSCVDVYDLASCRDVSFLFWSDILYLLILGVEDYCCT